MTDEQQIQERLQLESRFKSGADWFFWIAGLSLVNSIIVLAGGEWSFVVGLGATQIIDYVGKEFGHIGKMIGLVFNLGIAGLFVLFGVLARKRQVWSFILGMVLYGLDGLLFLLGMDFLSIGFHVFALFMIWNGLSALRKLMSFQPRQTAAPVTAPPESPAPAADPAARSGPPPDQP